jgi:hypothetical protein
MRKKAMLKQLNAALDSALFRNAHFGDIGGEKLTYRGKEYDVTEFIRDNTRLYRQTWIIAPIVRAIQEIERDIKKT